MLKDVLLVIAVLLTFFVGFIAVRGVDRFFGNSGKWIKRQFEKNKKFLVSKIRRAKKSPGADSSPADRFFRRKIGESRRFTIKKMENRVDL